MNNTEIIAGIDMIINGLSALKAAFSDADSASSKPAPTMKNQAPKKDIMPAPVSHDEPKDAAGDKTYTQAELSSMKYNDFKKLAASLGVDCRGTRDEIMNRVLATGIVSDAEASEDKPSVNKSGKKSNPDAKRGKLGAKKAAKEERDEFDEQAEEIAKETSYKDIIESLKDVGITATKLNYKAQLAKALREGLLDVDDEDESDEEFSASIYTPEYDLSGMNDPGKMSDERSEAVQAKVGEILDSISSEKLSQEDIIDYLQNNASQEELDLLGDEYTEEDLLKLYIEVVKHFIDDDGDTHEPGEPYAVQEENFCCGQPLKYDKKTKRFLCEHCTSEYEAE